MVCSFLGEDGSKLGEFGGKGGFRLVLFGFHGEFSGGSELGDDGRSLGDGMGFPAC